MNKRIAIKIFHRLHYTKKWQGMCYNMHLLNTAESKFFKVQHRVIRNAGKEYIREGERLIGKIREQNKKIGLS